jgi:hypothetical protein
MKLIKQTLSVFMILIVLGGMGAGGYFAIKYIKSVFARLDFQVAVLVAIASIVTLLASLIIARSIRRSSGQHWTNQLHAQKTVTYQFLIDLWQDLTRQGTDSAGQIPDTLSSELQVLDRQLILYGSPGVIKAHTVLRGLGRAEGMRNPDLRLKFAQVLIEIRKDLGSHNLGFSIKELEELLIVEADEPRNNVRVSAPLTTRSTATP